MRNIRKTVLVVGMVLLNGGALGVFAAGPDISLSEQSQKPSGTLQSFHPSSPGEKVGGRQYPINPWFTTHMQVILADYASRYPELKTRLSALQQSREASPGGASRISEPPPLLDQLMLGRGDHALVMEEGHPVFLAGLGELFRHRDHIAPRVRLSSDLLTSVFASPNTFIGFAGTPWYSRSVASSPLQWRDAKLLLESTVAVTTPENPDYILHLPFPQSTVEVPVSEAGSGVLSSVDILSMENGGGVLLWGPVDRVFEGSTSRQQVWILGGEKRILRVVGGLPENLSASVIMDNSYVVAPPSHGEVGLISRGRSLVALGEWAYARLPLKPGETEAKVVLRSPLSLATVNFEGDHIKISDFINCHSNYYAAILVDPTDIPISQGIATQVGHSVASNINDLVPLLPIVPFSGTPSPSSGGGGGGGGSSSSGARAAAAAAGGGSSSSSR